MAGQTIPPGEFFLLHRSPFEEDQARRRSNTQGIFFPTHCIPFHSLDFTFFQKWQYLLYYDKICYTNAMIKKLIISNWKENPDTLVEAENLLEFSENFLFENNLIKKNYDFLFAVPNIFATSLIEQEKNIFLQDISKFERGAHTGEISYLQARDIGVLGSIVGHSERRISRINIHGDLDIDVNQKLKNLLNNNLTGILCIGESDLNSDWKSYLKNQIDMGLFKIEEKKLVKLIVAYEPIWAIGENALRSAKVNEIEERIFFIKQILKEKFNNLNFSIPVIYGGSVDSKNIVDILNINICDGVLIGRASSIKENWEDILNSLKESTQ